MCMHIYTHLSGKKENGRIVFGLSVCLDWTVHKRIEENERKDIVAPILSSHKLRSTQFIVNFSLTVTVSFFARFKKKKVLC